MNRLEHFIRRWKPARNMWASHEPVAKIAFYYDMTADTMFNKIKRLRKKHEDWFPIRTDVDKDQVRIREEYDKAHGFDDYIRTPFQPETSPDSEEG